MSHVFSLRLRSALSFFHMTKIGNEAETSKGQSNLKDALINAGILAGFNFFATLAGISVAQIITNPEKALIAAVVSAGLGFFSRLLVERGMKPTPVTA